MHDTRGRQAVGSMGSGWATEKKNHIPSPLRSTGFPWPLPIVMISIGRTLIYRSWQQTTMLGFVNEIRVESNPEGRETAQGHDSARLRTGRDWVILTGRRQSGRAGGTSDLALG